MSDINQVLAPGEKILWEDKPQFLPFITSTATALLFGLIMLGMALMLLYAGADAAAFGSYAVLGAIIGVGSFGYSLLNFRFVHYVITDKRTIIEQGVIGRDFVGIEHDQIVSTSVNVGLADKLFGRNSGSVMIIHAGSPRGKNGSIIPVGLRSITDPYKTYQLLNQISHNVRTDIQYPNAMRPAENPGYNTEYKQ